VTSFKYSTTIWFKLRITNYDPPQKNGILSVALTVDSKNEVLSFGW